MSQSSSSRFILPKPEGYEKPPRSPDHERKRKREPVNVACEECRKSKSKCDAKRPACSRCQQRDVECHYRAPEGLTSRQADKQKIESLQRADLDSQRIFGFLRQGSEADAFEVARQIRQADNIHHAVTMMAEARALQAAYAVGVGQESRLVSPGYTAAVDISPWSRDKLLASPFDDPAYIFTSTYSYAHDKFVEKDMFVDLTVLRLDISRWTTVSHDNQLMNHLLALFWTWDNNTEPNMYRPAFEEDLSFTNPHEDDPQKRRFCSSFLVNALLALSCLYTKEPSTYSEADDPATRGRRFAEEANILLERELASGQPSIPLLQGLWAMFCYEGNLGSGEKSVTYFSKAIDVYKALNQPGMLRPPSALAEPARLFREHHALSWIMWGLYVTEWRASHAMGFRKMVAKPLIERTWLHADFPLCRPESGSFWWYPYPMSLQAQQSMKIELREAGYSLAEKAEEVLDFLGQDEDLRPAIERLQRGIELYDEVAKWKYSVPDRLRFEECVLPYNIILHVAADLLLASLLRPFGQMSRDQFGKFDPRQQCCAHASIMMMGIWTYRSMAVLKTEYWLIHPITTAAFIVLQDLDAGTTQMDTFARASLCLHEMRETLPLASDCLSTINAAFKRLRVQLPTYAQRYFVNARHREDGLMHHAVASLMPNSESGSLGARQVRSWGPQYRELLEELEEANLD